MARSKINKQQTTEDQQQQLQQKMSAIEAEDVPVSTTAEDATGFIGFVFPEEELDGDDAIRDDATFHTFLYIPLEEGLDVDMDVRTLVYDDEACTLPATFVDPTFPEKQYTRTEGITVKVQALVNLKPSADPGMHSDINANSINTDTSSETLTAVHPKAMVSNLAAMKKICDRLEKIWDLSNICVLPGPFFKVVLRGLCDSRPDLLVLSPKGYVDMVFDDCALDPHALQDNLCKAAATSTFTADGSDLPKSVVRLCEITPLCFEGQDPEEATTALLTLTIPIVSYGGTITIYGVRQIDPAEQEQKQESGKS